MNHLHDRKSKLFWVFLGLFWLGIPASWAENPSEEASEYYFKRIAVAPVLVGHRQPNMDETLDDTLSCAINQICAEEPSIQSNAGPRLMRLIHSDLKRRFGRHVVPLDQVEAAYAGIQLDATKDSPRNLALRMGQSLDADLMVIATVWRYRDRGAIEGFPDKPASVAFALYLVEPASGRQFWRGVFDEAQEFALKDMGKFADRIKMGLKWLSADELAHHGVKAVLRMFPNNIKPFSKKKNTY